MSNQMEQINHRVEMAHVVRGSLEEERKGLSRRHKKQINLLGIFLIAFILGAAGFGWWKMRDSNNYLSDEPAKVNNDLRRESHENVQKIVEGNEPSEQVIEWEVYENEEYGFKFEYPKEFEVKSYNVTKPKLYVEMYKTENQSSPYDLSNYFELHVTKTTNKISDEQLYDYVKQIDPQGNNFDYTLDPNGKLNVQYYTNDHGVVGVWGSVDSDKIPFDTLERYVFLRIIDGVQYFGVFDLRQIDLDNKNEIEEYRRIYKRILDSFEFVE